MWWSKDIGAYSDKNEMQKRLCFSLFSDSQFPINIVAVKNDHDFLEKDLVEPLYR